MTDLFDPRGRNSGAAVRASAARADHFTPRRWAEWLADTSGALRAWLDGESVLDPTCGRGDLLLGLMAAAVRGGMPVGKLPIRRLFGIERNAEHLRALVRNCIADFDVNFPVENLCCTDFLRHAPPTRADVLLGNPPWANFVDLSAAQKAVLKPQFARYGLAADRRGLLLGGARIDVAALVVVKAIGDHLAPHGRASFFLPLSLLTGDGAHASFRKYEVDGVSFAVTEVIDFAGVPAFPGVATRYGVVNFRRDAEPRWPIPWRDPKGESVRWAAPIAGEDGPLAVAETPAALDRLRRRPGIFVPNGARPRQGVNPCGASGVFFVSDVVPIDTERVAAESPAVGRVALPRRFVYPLMTPAQFAHDDAPPTRWVLLPHDPVTGQPLTAEQVETCPELAEYLKRCRPILEKRPGRWLGRLIERGQWWALLGVGPYCFAPFRVAWPAYGISRFTPKVFAAPWQGRQALHAHIACPSRNEAERLQAALAAPSVEEYLRAFGTAGTRNFAQPGRIRSLLDDQISSQTTT